MKKRDVKGRSSSKDRVSSKSFYTKLAVIGVIVAVVVGLFLFAGLRGVGFCEYMDTGKRTV